MPPFCFDKIQNINSDYKYLLITIRFLVCADKWIRTPESRLRTCGLCLSSLTMLGSQEGKYGESENFYHL